jgi:protein tyrosine/serine phosphatase
MIGIKQIYEYIEQIENSADFDINEINIEISKVCLLMKTDKENLSIYETCKEKFINLKKRKKIEFEKENESKNKKYNENEIQSKKHNAIEKQSHWIAINNGFLKIGHKPGGKNRSFQSLKNEGTTTIFTILSEREGAKGIQENCIKLNIDWIWLPLSNGDIPNKNLNIKLIEIFELIRFKLHNNEKIYLHCSAGLHRTGMITNCILRFLGFDALNSYEIIKKLRLITANEVGQKRLDFGNQFYNVNV